MVHKQNNNEEPMMFVPIRDFLENSVNAIKEEVKDIKQNISSITNTFERFKETQRGHYESCPNTQICRKIKIASDHWPITIMVIAGCLLLSSAALVSAYETWVKPDKKEITVTIQELRQAMREEKDITIRGGSITKENEKALEETIKSMNK